MPLPAVTAQSGGVAAPPIALYGLAGGGSSPPPRSGDSAPAPPMEELSRPPSCRYELSTSCRAAAPTPSERPMTPWSARAAVPPKRPSPAAAQALSETATAWRSASASPARAAPSREPSSRSAREERYAPV